MSEEADEPEGIERFAAPAAVLAVVAAAAPHFFFSLPIHLHTAGDSRGWIGMVVWGPAVLAGVAFMFGVDLAARRERVVPANVLVGLAVCTPIAYMLFAGWRYQDLMSPGASLAAAGGLVAAYALGGALEAVFWQGFVQGRVLSAASPPLRAAAVPLGAVLIWAPYMVATGARLGLSDYLPRVAIEGVLLAVLFELGLDTRGCAFVGALFGVIYVWSHSFLLVPP